MPRVAQLRLYTVEEGKLEDFVKAWLSGVRPLRERYGFRIESAWKILDESKFAWILSYEGRETWQEKDDAYYASPERKKLQPDPARFIVHSEDWFIEPVDLR